MRLLLVSLLLAIPAVAHSGDLGVMEMSYLNAKVATDGSDLPKDGALLAQIAEYGLCVAGRMDSRILSYIPESPGDRKSQFDMNWAPEKCSARGNYSAFAPMVTRGEYAEKRLLNDYDVATGVEKKKHQKIFEVPDAVKGAALTPNQQSALSFVQFGECVAAVDRAGIARLFATAVGTDAESAAFGSLTPVMAQCLSPGLTLKVNKLKLRGYLAEGAYRQFASAAK